MAVVATNPDATSEVLAENRFNDPPQDGNQFYMVTVRLKYLGLESSDFNHIELLKAVGQSAVIYTNRFSTGRCGVIPNNILFAPEVFTGGEITGNVCWEIASTDADSLQIFVDVREERTRETIRTWFALR